MTAEQIAQPPRSASPAESSPTTPRRVHGQGGDGPRRHEPGDYYEVVLRQTFPRRIPAAPPSCFERMQQASPSPYEFLLQFGDEQLVGASPEMFVRVEGARVETCPIAGTARRTGDPLKDADNIRELFNSAKEESELTMCTDVDRNDKSRVCVPGSVQGDRPAADRILCRRVPHGGSRRGHAAAEVSIRSTHSSAHMWAVTVIGAPKKAAAQAIEELEKNARGWYGGAVGMLSLNGDINTGILIRTIHLRDGVAEYPVGATLLYDSDPEMEERETRLKATGFFRALRRQPRRIPADREPRASPERRPKMLLVDNDDCFIHTLANYARQTGAEVVTYRAGFPLELIDEITPDLILVSPGPGRPRISVCRTGAAAARPDIPVFGVCLGLQGIVEAFGGELGVLDYPMHGKPSTSHAITDMGVFEGLPEQIPGRPLPFALRDSRETSRLP